jgi:hypothetical protein
LQHGVARRRIGRQQLAGLLREVDQDRPGFEERQRLAARALRIEDRRDLAVGIERDELGLNCSFLEISTL